MDLMMQAESRENNTDEKNKVGGVLQIKMANFRWTTDIYVVIGQEDQTKSAFFQAGFDFAGSSSHDIVSLLFFLAVVNLIKAQSRERKRDGDDRNAQELTEIFPEVNQKSDREYLVRERIKERACLRCLTELARQPAIKEIRNPSKCKEQER